MFPQSKIDALIAKFDKVEAAISLATKGEEIDKPLKEYGELKPVADKARALFGETALDSGDYQT